MAVAASAFPPVDLAPAEKLAGLRRALEEQNWEEAERQWLILIRGLVGHSEAERMARARAYECYAALLMQMDHESQADQMLARARATRQGAVALPLKSQRREMTYSFMKEIQAEEGFDTSKAEEVKRRLDLQIAASERRQKLLTISGFTVAGLMGGIFFGLNVILGGLLGLAVGGAFERKWLFSRH
jgi:hypothetical protein